MKKKKKKKTEQRRWRRSNVKEKKRNQSSNVREEKEWTMVLRVEKVRNKIQRARLQSNDSNALYPIITRVYFQSKTEVTEIISQYFQNTENEMHL